MRGGGGGEGEVGVRALWTASVAGAVGEGVDG